MDTKFCRRVQLPSHYTNAAQVCSSAFTLCQLLAELWSTIYARFFSVYSPDQFFQPQISPTFHLLQQN